ncbi:MAG: 50S ribosomal protein L11 methyltransferase [Paludibacteraceae bacterium]|nr:50S ribosomal protein L11 methyltransferase [Paludibacteraceae bacterium]
MNKNKQDMQYIVAEFEHNLEDWQQSLFTQDLADIGFEAFDGPKAYIQKSMFEETKLQDLMAQNPQVHLIGWAECPDENWNQIWEQEHPFFDVKFGSQKLHIIPHCAFGAGYHETTTMMLSGLDKLSALPTPFHVLDNGCGTGILGIAAAKLGARVTAIDIDSHSVESTQENALINHVDIQVFLGDTPPEGQYDLILSNIHRNIIIAQMADYARLLNPEGELWTSGFLDQDCEKIIEAAKREQLIPLAKHSNGEWRMLKFKKS